MEKESLKLSLIKKSENKNIYLIEDNNNLIKGLFKIIKPDLKDYIQIIANFNNYYDEKFYFNDFKLFDCFKYSTEENLDDIYNSIIEFINENQYIIYDDKYGDIFTIIFNDEIRRKKLTSTINLTIKETLENNEIINDLLYYISNKNDIKDKDNINNNNLLNNIIVNSSLLFDYHITLLNYWFKSKFTLNKIYDSDIDEKTPEGFHKKCDKINNVLVLIESNFGKLFGGFTTVCFDSINGGVKGNDEKDFIFSLTEKTVCRKKTGGISIFNNINYFPTFGGPVLFITYSYDIFLDKDCFKEINLSICSLGNNFSSPNIVLFNKRTFLPGGEKFWVKKMEIFKVNLN
jgi:hypothetical protein